MSDTRLNDAFLAYEEALLLRVNAHMLRIKLSADDEAELTAARAKLIALISTHFHDTNSVWLGTGRMRLPPVS